MRFCCVYIPDFPVAAVIRQAGITGPMMAVAVVEGAPPLDKVMATNAGARARGAYPGMTRVQAETCAGLVIRRRSTLAETAAQAAMLDCAHAISPRVEATAADTLLLDLAGLEPLFGPPPAIARTLTQQLAAAGMEGHCAVAPQPDAAIIAARGYAGITVMDATTVAERLGPLAIDVLQPAPEILETLDRWGVRTLKALAALPALPLSERLGQEGLRLQKLARGETQRPLVPVREEFHFEEALELEEPVEMLEPLAFLLNHLLGRLCTRLRARALATNELHLHCQLEAHPDVQLREQAAREPGFAPQFERHIRLPVPMLDAQIFLRLLQLDLQAHPPAGPVRALRLGAEPVRPRPGQAGLFLPQGPQPERLEVTLARIRNLIGDVSDREPRAGSPGLLDTHRPDAFRMQRFDPQAARAEPAVTTCARAGALRMLRPPVPIRVECRSGQPAAILLHDQRLPVSNQAGPWRTSGDWWTLAPWSRDEWDVETGAGLLRIYHDRLGDRWFLQAAYD